MAGKYLKNARNFTEKFHNKGVDLTTKSEKMTYVFTDSQVQG